ncbi:hypothetical protein RB9198 [Rhodopirellula baltica SH 1]|uniref:Uncharacterized protein n=1 Tax=Rhodopirellula baltica (strain DSM 10527 / NCIMB 13988 / SH1) TaxID=243090 RepID=Q7ULY3_RHOBA|nr:hypothetical protein RB9198 [Rhodopirellula baltica SH 1]
MDPPRQKKSARRSRLASAEASARVPGETWPTLPNWMSDRKTDRSFSFWLVQTAHAKST